MLPLPVPAPPDPALSALKFGSMDKEAGRLQTFGKLVGAGSLAALGAVAGTNAVRPRAITPQDVKPTQTADPADTRGFWEKFKEGLKSLAAYESPSPTDNSRAYNIGRSIYNYFTDTPPDSTDPKFENTWWSYPAGTLGPLATGIGTYQIVKASGQKSREKKLQKQRDAAKRQFESALFAEQQSKLGSALDAFIDAYEETAPFVFEKDAGNSVPSNAINTVKGITSTLALLAFYLSFKRGFQNSGSGTSLSAMNDYREKALAKRQISDLDVVPENVPQAKVEKTIKRNLPALYEDIYPSETEKTSSCQPPELSFHLPLMTPKTASGAGAARAARALANAMLQTGTKGGAKNVVKSVPVPPVVPQTPRVPVPPAVPQAPPVQVPPVQVPPVQASRVPVPPPAPVPQGQGPSRNPFTDRFWSQSARNAGKPFNAAAEGFDAWRKNNPGVSTTLGTLGTGTGIGALGFGLNSLNKGPTQPPPVKEDVANR
jgi:hypothetical protein